MYDALFLDRDGVLNRLRKDDYVKRPEELEVLDGVKEAIEIFKSQYRHIFIVTNQQGIGKGLMTEDDLRAVHEKLLQEIGHIERIFYCPHLQSDNSFLRKPNIGMALQAKREYTDINLKHCTMVGDSKSDMLFGKRAGMTTVLVGEKNEIANRNPHLVDHYYPTLLNFAQSL